MTDLASGLSAPAVRATRAARSRLVKSDWFTIAVHWTSAIAMVLSLFTGMRIAADGIGAVVPKWFLPILLQGEMWSVHFYAGLALFGSASAYLVYLKAGALFDRNSLGKLRVLALPTSMRMKWGAVNVALHWLLYALVLVMFVTGVLMFTGRGGWIITVHRFAAEGAIVYIFAHIIAHFMYGGWWQLLRIFVPQSLKVEGAATSRPAWLALAAAVPAVVAVGAIDLNTRDTLHMRASATMPDLAKSLDDPAWASATPVFVHTAQGTGMPGGAGESLVELRALRFEEKAYFAFRWEDPNRSVARVPLKKEADGWHLMASDVDRMDVADYYDDKFSIVFTTSEAFGDGGIIHLGALPAEGKPTPMNERGLHFTTDGSTNEMWQWKSTRGGMLGSMDHQFIGPPREPTEREAKGLDRYQGGYSNYEGSAPYTYNWVSEPVGGYKGPVKVKFLPKDLAATKAAMGAPLSGPDDQVTESQRYWMMDNEVIPYSAEADALIPVGTVLPGVVLKNGGQYTGERAALKANAQWADGHWTLIVSRTARKEGKYDSSFEPGAALNIYVAAYDHTQTRHTRHQRPVRLRVE